MNVSQFHLPPAPCWETATAGATTPGANRLVVQSWQRYLRRYLIAIFLEHVAIKNSLTNSIGK
jgi:hypothetical protein